MDIGKQVRVLVKEELDKQLGEIREQIAGLSHSARARVGVQKDQKRDA